MLILSIDPGETTGICIADCSNDEFGLLLSKEIVWAKRFMAFDILLSGMFVMPNNEPLVPDIVIIENFRLMPHKSRSQIGKVFPSSQIIGMVSYLCWRHNYRLIIQEPGVRSRTKVLEEHKDMMPAGQHVIDAYQHARYYYVTAIRGKLQKEA